MMRPTANFAMALSAILSIFQLFAQDRPKPDPEQTLDAFTRALGKGQLVENQGAMDLLEKLRGLLPVEDWEDSKERLLTELVRSGDRVVSRYTSGDEVPLQREDYVQCADWFEAASKLEKLDPSPRSESRALFCRGQSLVLSRKFPEGIQALNGAERLASDQAFLYNALGVAYLLEVRNTQAATQFNEAIKREPSWTYPQHNLALTLMEIGDYDGAQKWYKKAIATDKRNGLDPGYLHYNLGLLEHQLGQKREAQQQYQTALKLFRHQADLNLQREAQLTAQSRPADAAAAADRAASFRRDEAEAYNALGALWASQGKIVQAANAYQQALSLVPGMTAAQRNLVLLKQRGKPDADPKKPASPATGSGGQFPEAE